MEVVGVDETIVERVARVLRNNKPELPRLDLFDDRFYPPRDADRETALRYFLVMVAMDHRLSRPGRPYEACLDDGCYRGADLLYRLGSKMLREDPLFFSPERLAKVTIEEVKRAFSAGSAEPPDAEVRAMLLRDLGYKLTKLYDGSVSRILELASNRVRGTLLEPGLADLLRVFRAYEDPVEKKTMRAMLLRDLGYKLTKLYDGSVSRILELASNRVRGTLLEPGLADLLRVFRAYEDPVEKKTMLFAKFIVGRGYFQPIDELDVAVDNHLCRVAYRLGLVTVSGPLWRKIKEGVEVTYDEDVLLRLVVRRAYKLLATRSGLSPALVDDYFWIMGRTTCTRDEPG